MKWVDKYWPGYFMQQYDMPETCLYVALHAKTTNLHWKTSKITVFFQTFHYLLVNKVKKLTRMLLKFTFGNF